MEETVDILVLISIHAPREGSDQTTDNKDKATEISIHPPREGSDALHNDYTYKPTQISIHAPREGSDSMQQLLDIYSYVFQSTLPVKGATRLGR